MLLLLLTLCLIPLSLSDEQQSCSSPIVPGSFTWSNGGSTVSTYIIQAGGANSWGPVTTQGSTVTSQLGPRYYLANSCANEFGPSVFQKIYPLGSKISFTVNLASVGCGLNAAFYLVGMPSSGSGSNGDYYCDGNCVGGSCCTEMDIMEANRHSLQVTPHRCTGLTSGCDGGGCARNTNTIPNGYGPSSSYTINTQNPFTVSVTFETSGGQLSSIVTVISQGSQSITLTHDSSCGSGYLSGLDQAFQDGLVAVWSFWSGSMSWLDGSACSSDTNEMSNSQYIFSNLVVEGPSSIHSPPTPPPPPPALPPVSLPPSSSSQTCGSNGCTSNEYWVEFVPPSGSTNPGTASVTCSSGATYPCTWFSVGAKYQCPCNSICTNPVPKFNGVDCYFGSSAVADAIAQSNNGYNTGTIVGITVGCVVGGILLIAIIVVIVMKKKKNEEHV